MHDASGCNSTYNTHDEPRWYDFDSMVYISGLSEMEAIMGDDQKFIDDIVYTAKELSPNFIAMAGTPIPTMIGTDFKAIANIIEKETNIPTFGFDTTGMHSYVSGAYKAFEALAKRFLKRNDKESRVEKKESIDKESREAKNTIIKVNILGATPLDFSINKSVEAMVDLLKENNFEVISTWAMGSSLEYIKNAGKTSVLAEHELIGKERGEEDFCFLGLRTMKGIDNERFEQCFKRTVTDAFGTVIEDLVLRGFLEKTEWGYCLTSQGLLYGNYVFSRFLR